MDTNKTTILIIRHNGDAVKSYTINTRYLENIKKLIFATGTLFTVFFLVLIALFVNSNNIKFDNRSYLTTSSSESSILKSVDTITLNEKLNRINYNLSQISDFLVERGIITSDNKEENVTPYYYGNYSSVKTMEEESVVFLKTLTSLPIGLPYDGKMSSEYGLRSNPFGGRGGEFHPGIDFKGPYGDAVYATGEGIVEDNDWNGGYGNAVVINHKFGLTTLYGHLSKVNVNKGDKVRAGDLIGFIGSTGRSTGPHLHYEIRKNGDDIDPNPFLKLNL
ncbi:MAG: M23 family metallopeptidase [Ignavibacteriae bacterium]|nr:MAG: M23 family metallopeptidase [Ignavibacteriota bacterium]